MLDFLDFFGFFWIFGWDASKRGEDIDWVWIGFRLVGNWFKYNRKAEFRFQAG